MNEEILKVKVVVDTSAARRPLQQFQRDVKSSSLEVANMDRRFLSMGNTLRNLRNFSFKNLFSDSGYKNFANDINNLKSSLGSLAVGSAATAKVAKDMNTAKGGVATLAAEAGIAGVAVNKVSKSVDGMTKALNAIKGKTLGISQIGKETSKLGVNVNKAKTGLYDLQTAYAKMGKMKSFIDLEDIQKEFEVLKSLNPKAKLSDLYKDTMLSGWGHKNKGVIPDEYIKQVDKALIPLRKMEIQLKKISNAPNLADKLRMDKSWQSFSDRFKGKLPIATDISKEGRKINWTPYTDGLNRLKEKWGEVVAKAQEMHPFLTTMTSKILGIVGIVAELAAVIKTIKTTIERANVGTKVMDDANKALMSYKAYQEWGYVLQQNGIEQKQLATAMKTFGTLLESNADSLKKYGITSKNVNEAFGQAVYYIQGLSTQTEKLTVAQELFGKRVASELMPVLNMNKAQTVDLMRTYEALGGTMSNYLVESSHTLTDNITHLKAAMAGVGNVIAEAFIPMITKVVQWLTVLIAKIRIVLQALFGASNWISKIKGKMSDLAKGTGSKGGIGGLADGANKTADGLKKANKQAEKLRRYLIGIDELNVMPDKNKTAGSDSTGGTPDVGGIGDLGDMGGSLMDGLDSSMLDKIEAFKKKIDNLKDIIRIATPIFLVGAGAIMAVLGACTANIPVLIAGLGLAGIGVAIGKANGTWDELFKKPVQAWKKHKAGILVGVGGVVALLGAVTGNIPLLIGGLGLAAIGFSVNAKQNKGWDGMFKGIQGAINAATPYITMGIGLMMCLYGFVTANIPLALVGAGIAGISFMAGRAGGWGNYLSGIISDFKNWGAKIKGVLKDIKDNIIDWFEGTWLGEKLEKFKNFFKDFKLSDCLPNMGNWDIFKNIDFDKVKDALGKIAEIAKKIILPDFSGLSALKDLAGNKIANIKIKFSDTKEKLKDKWKDLTGHIKDKTAKFKAKIEAKKEQLKAAWNKVVEGVKGKAVSIGVKIKAAKDVIKQWWADVKDKLKVGTIELGVKIKDKWEDIKDAWQKNIIDKAQGAKVKIETYIGTKWSDIKDSWNALKEKMDGHKANIKVGIPKWSSLSYTWTKLMNKFKGKTVSMKLKIQATVSNLKGWVNTNLIDKINGKLRESKLFKSIQIPRLAKGGVLTTPTMALMGEYPGANNNPEIVAPQSILKETVISANGELANVFIQMSRQIVNAIENKEMDVRIGDDAIARSAARGNQNFRLATGKNIF